MDSNELDIEGLQAKLVNQSKTIAHQGHGQSYSEEEEVCLKKGM